MARDSSSKLIEWGGILIVAFFFVPRLLAALSASNARTAVQFSPGAALSAQEARGINTAGTIGNTALGNFLSSLLGQNKPQPKPAGGSGAGGGGGGLPQNPRGTISQENAGGIPSQLTQLLNPDGSLNLRQPDYQSFITQPTSDALVPPTINFGTDPFGAGGVDWASIFSSAPPDLAQPDLSNVDFGGDLSSLNYSVYSSDFASLGAPDLTDFGSGGFDLGVGGYDFGDFSGVYDTAFASEDGGDF
jgi:hypothetical protein